jgi:hypothetical protein
MPRAHTHDVCQISGKKNEGGNYWSKIGAAFTDEHGRIMCILNALPIGTADDRGIPVAKIYLFDKNERSQGAPPQAQAAAPPFPAAAVPGEPVQPPPMQQPAVPPQGQPQQPTLPPQAPGGYQPPQAGAPVRDDIPF